MAPRRASSIVLAALLALLGGAPARAAAPPPWLPRYDLQLDLQLDQHRVAARQRVTWTNTGPLPTHKLVFNVASRYSVPDKDVGFLAKMLEILRLAPSEVLDFNGPACEVQEASLAGTPLRFAFSESLLRSSYRHRCRPARR
jgi:hypothetical protein